MEIKNILQKLGFSENEILVYITNLELGITAISNIAKFSGIKRTTLYAIVEKMEEKWFLQKYIKNNVSYYEATNPQELYEIFEKQIANLKQKLPELQALNNNFASKPKVYYFEWVENVAKLYKIELEDNPDLVRIFSSNANRKTGERNKLRKLRNEIFKHTKKKPDMKIILNREAYENEKNWKKFQHKTIRKEDLNLWISIKIYGNKTHFLSMNDSITGLLIENKEIAETMQSIFDYIYEEK